jgi:hypothetical protein
MATALHAEALTLAEHATTPPQRHYQAVIPGALLDPDGQLIDWLIDVTLGALDAQQLEIRVLEGPSDRLRITTGDYGRPLPSHIYSEAQ